MEVYDIFRVLALFGYVIPAIISILLIVFAFVATAVILGNGALDVSKTVGDHSRRRA